MLDKVTFQIAMGAVKHFGRNLYTSNPPAISELIANAWDAYAKKCEITVIDDTMIITDDGIGMTDDELINRYAKSGYEKNLDIRRPEDMKERPYMGKKGIGKFSVFSLGDNYIILTKSNLDEKWKKIHLNYDELYTDITQFEAKVDYIDNPQDCFPVSLLPIYIPENTGTIIIIPSIKRKINATTKASLMDLIAKRFSSSYFGEDYNFKLYFNYDEINEIKLREHFFYPKIEFVYFFGKEKSEIKQYFPNLNDDCLVETKDEYFETVASGWIGTVEKPNCLKADDVSVAGVSIYINGKLVDENIFKRTVEGRIANSYLVGEVDYVHNSEEDPVLSSREGLNYELDLIIELKEKLTKVKNELIENWNDMRSKRAENKQDYLNKMLETEEYKRIYNNYNEKEKEIFKSTAQKLFDKPDKIDDVEIQIMTPALIQIVNDKSLNEEINLENLEKEDLLPIFSKLFNAAEINHAIRLRSNFKNRLKIIEQLEKYIQDGEVEKVFEQHLAQNPWLINPMWEPINLTRISTQDKYKYLGIDNSEEQVRTDIIVETTFDNIPIIVEVKRSKKTNYSCPDVNEIFKQISNYRKAIQNEFKKNGLDVDISRIKAFFICGECEYNKLSPADMQILDTNRITLLTYEKILMTVKSTYSLDI